MAAPLITIDDILKISQDLHLRGAQRYYLQQVQIPKHLLVDPKLSIKPYSKTALIDLEKKKIRQLFLQSGVRGL